jgi:AraC family transcriptional regulator
MLNQVRPSSFGEVIKTKAIAGFILTSTKHRPGSSLSRHQHECAAINFTLGGRFREKMNNRQYDCEPGSVIIRPPGEAHADYFSPSGTHSFVIDLTPERFDSLRSHTELFDRCGQISNGLLAQRLRRIYREFTSPSPLSDLVIEGLLLETVAEATLIKAAYGQPSTPPFVREAADLLHAHFTEALTLTGLAARLGVHPSHLSRAFRRCYGCSVGQYVRRLRLEFAVRELAQSDRPIAEVAAAAGYYDQSHLTHEFRLYLSTTPAAFRESSRAHSAIG